MTFKDDFDEVHLLFAKPVHFELFADTQKVIPFYSFDLKLPTFGDYYFNPVLRKFIGFINCSTVELQEQFAFIPNISSHYSLLCSLLSCTDATVAYYLLCIKNSLEFLGLNIQFGCEGHRDNLYINNSPITEELFTRVIRIILVALALKKQSDFIDDPTLQAYQDKIAKIKKNSVADTSKGTDFTDAYLILIYEFGYSPEQILNMTQYTISMMLKHTDKSIKYKLSLIAAGNGHTKKIKFITDKGK